MSLERNRIFRAAYWIAVAALFAGAAWERFSLPLDPIADPDTWGYLSPALHQLTGAGFSHESRNFLYPGFLWVLLRLFGNFRAIPVAQHLLGLLAGAFLLLAWRRARAFAAESRLPSGAHEAFGLILAGVCLSAGEPVRAEMQIRPEGVCALFLSLNLWFVIEFVARAFVVREKAATAVGIGIACTAIVLASLKPSLVFLAAVSLVPIGIFFLRRNRRQSKIALGLGAVAAALVLLVPEYFLSRRDELARLFLPTNLFAVHADLIRDQMADDLQRGVDLPYPRDWLRRVHGQLVSEIAKSQVAGPEHYSSLGFSPDYLMYNETSISSRLLQESDYDFGAVTAFYRFYYLRTWQQRPVAMLRKIWHQLALFYQPVCPAYDREKVIELNSWYELSVSSLDRDPYRETWKRYPPAIDFMRRAELLSHAAPFIEQSKVVRRTVVFFAVMYLPLLGTTVLVGVAAVRWRNLRQRIGWLLVLALFVFAYNVAACLEVAIINSLEVPRYSTIQFVFTLFAEFLGLWLLLESILPQIRWGRPIQTSAPGE